MRFLTGSMARTSSAHGLKAVALMCAMMPLHASGEEMEARLSGAVTPLCDHAFLARAGHANTVHRHATRAVPVAARVKAIRADINVFAHRAGSLDVDPSRDLTAEGSTNTADLVPPPELGDAGAKVRSDLLAGVPDHVARLIVLAAREEGVDPNLMLSIARAENGAFDPTAVSGAGAIGIMQMLPATGAAYGADDLTDPVQNVRASAKFLKVLVDKYANPMLVAAAYNAGEPKVDVRTSLPLIRETADYVTRVVGLYTHAYAPGDIQAVGRMRKSSRSNGLRNVAASGGSSPARSSMLVFSANGHGPEGTGMDQQIQPPDGPVKVRKEGSL